jgi:hypothetical protein
MEALGGAFFRGDGTNPTGEQLNKHTRPYWWTLPKVRSIQALVTVANADFGFHRN